MSGFLLPTISPSQTCHSVNHFFTMDVLRIATTFCSFLSLLLLIIALASDYWITILKINSGLWQHCGGKNCHPYLMDVQAFVHVTRAFLLIGMLAGAASFFSLCISFYQPRIGSISTALLAVITSIAAGVCSMIAMSTFTGVYVAQFMTPGTKFGWSFCVGWASFPLFLITGGLAYMLFHHATEQI